MVNRIENNNKPLVYSFNLKFCDISEENYSPLNLNIQASYNSSKNNIRNFIRIQYLNLYNFLKRYFLSTFQLLQQIIIEGLVN
jgi:hypothetical protein